MQVSYLLMNTLSRPGLNNGSMIYGMDFPWPHEVLYYDVLYKLFVMNMLYK